jgi:hypothetical protein
VLNYDIKVLNTFTFQSIKAKRLHVGNEVPHRVCYIEVGLPAAITSVGRNVV